MTQIRFRAKRNYDNKWIYGYFTGIYQTEDGEVACIKDENGKDNLCVKETLEQCIEFNDKDDRDIYEDMIEVPTNVK